LNKEVKDIKKQFEVIFFSLLYLFDLLVK